VIVAAQLTRHDVGAYEIPRADTAVRERGDVGTLSENCRRWSRSSQPITPLHYSAVTPRRSYCAGRRHTVGSCRCRAFHRKK
jgi:hypothetical protein